MRHRLTKSLPTVALLLLAMLALSAQGCGSTPRAQWAEQRAALTAVQDSLVAAHEADKLDDQEFVEAARIALSVRSYLDRAQATFDDPDAYERVMSHVEAGLRALEEYQRHAYRETE